ncbi:hypothetical protein HYH03_017734 [Edaphochlamys debaryana]|nr:hypothetical protein HYH03_017734 [Edaphochlamys debaryana]|eukprot:KAG2483381.1 hypothetical protein HYH03_017734 [Edaphochlamys debaryana]
MTTSLPPAPPSAAPFPGGADGATRLAVAALQTGRRLLPPAGGVAAAGPWPAAASAQWAEQRADWWRLAVWTLVYGRGLLVDVEGGLLRQLYDMMVEALAGVWPERQLDLDALTAEAPPEVAAALEGGLLSGLTILGVLVTNSERPFLGPAFTELLAACAEAGPGPDPDPRPSSGPGSSAGSAPGPAGGGLALVLVPLLAYGKPEAAEAVLEGLGLNGGFILLRHVLEESSRRRYGAFLTVAGPTFTAAVRQAATGFLHATHGALRRCRRLAAAASATQATGALGGGPAAANPQTASSAAPAASAASGAPPPGPLQRLSDCVAFASELWGLPLPQGPTAGEPAALAPAP